MSSIERRFLAIVTFMIVAGFALMIFAPGDSRADWRWAPAQFKPHKIAYKCSDLKCLRKTYLKERTRLKHKIKLHDAKRLREWNHWTKLYIPQCTWYGESGQGPQFARYRYSVPNSQGSGAYGKYQMMPGTYHNRAKYHDWSPLDQEIAGHREYFSNGTSPWSNC